MAKWLKLLLTFGAFGGLIACAALHSPAGTSIVTESYLIASSDAGIQLYIRNKHAKAMRAFSAAHTVIYVNGTTQASESTFDLPLDGFSWMDYIAARGYDV